MVGTDVTGVIDIVVAVLLLVRRVVLEASVMREVVLLVLRLAPPLGSPALSKMDTLVSIGMLLLKMD